MPVEIPKTSPISGAEIEAAERQLGHRLPSAFREFVRAHDGAEPAANIFKVPGNESGVRQFIPVAEAADLRASIEGFPKHAIPIAEDDCGNYVWLDPTSGAVFFWDHEIDEPSSKIAANFDEFLSSLMPFDTTLVSDGALEGASGWIDPDFLAEQKKLGNA